MTTSNFFRLWAGAIACAAILAAPACSNPPSASGTTPGGDPGCELVDYKCSRCHEPERIASYRATTPRHLQSLVRRMRRKRGSMIDAREGRVITRCLVSRSFGDEGLDALMEGGSP